MTPTHRGEEIEGRSYKEYVYSPVPPSSTAATCQSDTPGRPSQELSTRVLTTDDQSTPDNQQLNNQVQQFTLEMAEEGSRFMQYLAAASANLCIVATGAMLGWTSSILPRLEEHASDSPLDEKITSEQSSWIGSLTPVGALVGSFLASYLADQWGRKRTLLLSVLPYTLGWILIATASNVIQFYIARIIFGVALSFAFTAVPMYCGEIAETAIRGVLGSFLQLFITIGLLYSYAIGPHVSYTLLWICCGCLPLIFFASFFFMPESPYFLLSKGRTDEAITSLARLRRKSPAAVQKEIDDMQVTIDEAFREETKISDLFSVKANFKALLYASILVTFQQMTGINLVLFYMETIFIEAGINPKESNATLIVGVVQVLASMVTPLVVDRFGRKMLLIVSGIGEVLTLCSLGLFFYLLKYEPDEASVIASWLPVLSLVVYISTYSIGWGPLPWAVMGEMFASNVKSNASGITVFVCWLFAFVITKFSTNINQAFGFYTTFWIFATFCLLSVLFTIFILPETKGKSLQEIQDELNGVKNSMMIPNDAENAVKK
ncbi:facilitated trehalose transporter Tret1-like [Prorops nasuta]|uniref:facilitated trehalose transporter Tret1-like n=1 Tax=Prorops nasuta TaxID=863751 RepID=UPI0034CE2E5C